MKKPYTVTYWLDEAVQRDIETVTALWNQFFGGLPRTPETVFDMAMQIASGEVIADRLGYLIKSLGHAVHGGPAEEASGHDDPGD